MVREGALGAATMALVTAPGATLLFAGSTARPALLGTLFLLTWNLGAFAFFRTAAYRWPSWVMLRRRHLRWDMTHTTLMAVLSVAAVVILGIVLLFLATGDRFMGGEGGSLPTRLVAALRALGIGIFLTVLGLVAVLAPAALISYFAAGRTARRLEALALAAGGIRQGDFTGCVTVDGEDEIASLQRDFNAMAAELERAVQNLRAERDTVARLLQAQRELVASVSHELRSPVATLRGYLEVLAAGASDSVNEHGDDLAIMRHEVARLQRLIDDLFILARAEVGQLTMDMQRIDVAALLRRCAGATAPGAWRGGRVEVLCEVMPSLPPVRADAGRLEQAVRNLLTNAIRHTPPGGLVALSASTTEGAVMIRVHDTGEGIAPAELARIFERFYRTASARRQAQAGAGLGLALVKELIEAMGGDVSVVSEPGAGSCFTLRLPNA